MVLHQSYVRCNMLSAWTARNQVGPMAFPVLRVRREDGDGRERYQSVSDQSCRNRGSRVQFCPGRVDCSSCLALAAQVNGGKTRARPLWPGIFCRLVRLLNVARAKHQVPLHWGGEVGLGLAIIAPG